MSRRTVPAPAEWPREALVTLVRAYRLFVSPCLPAACRFEPTCSAYALEALRRHGAATGTGLALRRLLRCGPWCEAGLDPVPARPQRLFRGLVDEATPSAPTPSPPP